ncbi:MAG: carboxypeptidase regulatory-like domain-containing protein [Tannerella sp.]|jgi:TonB-dependent SusC/RagA subfamily outer membrane receptor|nr:carboxypeptidase regulatory-like domain-containing protein [Tannerella sp.]
MEDFGIYSLKAGVILAFFWGIYCLFLQRETFYGFNRMFLLAGMAAAVTLPLITVRYAVEVRAAGIQPGLFAAPADGVLPVVADGARTEASLPELLRTLLPVLYVTALCGLLAVRSAGLFRLFRVIRRSRCRRHAGYILVESPVFGNSFSFFRYAIIPVGLSDADRRIILRHEEAHIRQKHWIDLFAVNILSLAWWFNPLVRFYEKALRNNHEYLADREALADCGQAAYRQTLVSQWFRTPVFPMADSFSQSNHIKRISMMKKNSSNPARKLFSLLAVPAMAAFLWFFAEPEYIRASAPEPLRTVASGQANERSFSQAAAGGYTRILSEKPAANGNSFNSVPQRGKTPLIIINGKKTDRNLSEFDPKSISTLTVLKDWNAIEKYGEEGRNGVVEISTGEMENREDSLAANFKRTEEHKRIAEERRRDSNTVSIAAAVSLSDTFPAVGFSDTARTASKTDFFLNMAPGADRPAWIVDGELKDSLCKDFLPTDIESISILKDRAASAIYGKKARNGVVLITTRRCALKKSFSDINLTGDSIKIITERKILPAERFSGTARTASKTNLFLNMAAEADSSMWIVDGERQDSLSKEIKPEDIQSLSILKAANATAVYGEEGRNGVILVTTKANKDKLPDMVRGIVKDGDGKPIQNASVGNPASEETVLTDENGKFSLRTAPGSIRITVSHEDYSTTTVGCGSNDMIYVILKKKYTTCN